MYDRVLASLRSSPVVDRNGYQYFVNPLTDGVPRMDPAVLGEVVDWIMGSPKLSECELLVLPEAMGIPLGVPVSMRTGIPYTVVRKKGYGLPGETEIVQKTGYSTSVMHVNGVSKGERVAVIDDVVSTGGTLVALIRALRDDIGAEIVDVAVPVDKAEGAERVEAETGVHVRCMVRASVVDGHVVAEPFRTG